jgi:hypothetical protein
LDKQDKEKEPMGRSDESDRPNFDIDFTADDPSSLQSSVGRVKAEEIRHRQLLRNEEHEDRLEWVLRWQQSLILVFLAFCLVAAAVAGGWALHIELWGGDAEQTERAHHIFEILMDAGIAALVGFFAIKRFEK